MLRCTLAGMMPLMATEKYASLSQELYEARRDDFYKIQKKKSYYAIPDLPIDIAKEVMSSMLPDIISSQKKNGLWGKGDNSKLTYEILSALKHIGILDELYREKKLNDISETIEEKEDIYFLLIKKQILGKFSEEDRKAEQKLSKEYLAIQEEDGSWEHSVVATVYYLDKLLMLGKQKEDKEIQKGINFLLDSQVQELDAYQKNGPYGLVIQNVFTKDRMLEFEKAEKFYEEYIPRSKCFTHIALMQNALCLKLLQKLGYEDNEKVVKSMESIYGLYKEYGGFCISDIRKKYEADVKKQR